MSAAATLPACQFILGVLLCLQPLIATSFVHSQGAASNLPTGASQDVYV